MRFAFVNGKKSEATKGSKGICRACRSELIAKCGEIYVHHWAHKGNRNCDAWWENETAWHRDWKNQFPSKCQEEIQYANNGEKHIADVKTEEGWALEFQHSYLNPEERRARNGFYNNLVWVVDGTRRKRDRIQFGNIIDYSTKVSATPIIYRVSFPDECRLLKEWLDCSGPVFFDFQEKDSSGNLMLWCLSGNYLISFTKKSFIKTHQCKNFSEVMQDITLKIDKIIIQAKKTAHEEECRQLGSIYLPKKRRPNYRL